jgi:Protein of unknown function (DUF3343).
MDTQYAVVLIDSTSHAMRIEKLLISRGLGCKLIPVPRHLSSDCGICVRIEASKAPAIRELLRSENMKIISMEEL